MSLYRTLEWSCVSREWNCKEKEMKTRQASRLHIPTRIIGPIWLFPSLFIFFVLTFTPRQSITKFWIFFSHRNAVFAFVFFIQSSYKALFGFFLFTKVYPISDNNKYGERTSTAGFCPAPRYEDDHRLSSAGSATFVALPSLSAWNARARTHTCQCIGGREQLSERVKERTRGQPTFETSWSRATPTTPTPTPRTLET